MRLVVSLACCTLLYSSIGCHGTSASPGDVTRKSLYLICGELRIAWAKSGVIPNAPSCGHFDPAVLEERARDLLKSAGIEFRTLSDGHSGVPDEWGNPIRYDFESNHFIVYSVGPDGRDGRDLKDGFEDDVMILHHKRYGTVGR